LKEIKIFISFQKLRHQKLKNLPDVNSSALFLVVIAIKFFENVKIGKTFSSSLSRIRFLLYSPGITTRCTRFHRLMSNSDPRKMDMYIQVCSIYLISLLQNFILKNSVEKFDAKLGGVN
jgi:hypothetical protein